MRNIWSLSKILFLTAALALAVFWAGCISIQRHYYQCPRGEDCCHHQPVRSGEEGD